MESNGLSPVSNVLVELAHEPTNSNPFIAHVVGMPEMQGKGATQEEAIRELSELLRLQLHSGRIVSISVPTENPVMKFFGHAKDDPYHERYLEEIRRFREESDTVEAESSEDGTCSSSSSIPTT